MGYINKTEERLSGGHHNSLGNTVQVVEDILQNKKLLEDLCDCYGSEDDVVRMRVSSAIKRIAKAKPEWVVERLDWLIDDVSKLDQPSAKWTLAQVFMLLDDDLSVDQRNRAVEVMKFNLKNEKDWIVMNFTSEALLSIALKDKNQELIQWLKPELKKMSRDKRKSVSGRGKKFLQKIQSTAI